MLVKISACSLLLLVVTTVCFTRAAVVDSSGKSFNAYNLYHIIMNTQLSFII